MMILVMATVEATHPVTLDIADLWPGRLKGTLVADAADVTGSGNSLSLHQEYPINSLAEGL